MIKDKADNFTASQQKRDITVSETLFTGELHWYFQVRLLGIEKGGVDAQHTWINNKNSIYHAKIALQHKKYRGGKLD